MTAPGPPDVELIVKALHPYRFTTTGYQREAAIDVLTALAGRLLPNGGWSRTEYGPPRMSLLDELADDDWDQEPADATHTRTVTTYPDGTAVTTPWKEIDG